MSETSPTDGLSPLMDMRLKLTEAQNEIERLETSIKLIHWMVGQEGIDKNIIAENVCAICDQALDSKEQT